MAELVGKRALVTGANGFIGRPVCRALLANGFEVVAAARTASAIEPGCQPAIVSDLSTEFDWAAHLSRVTHVFHLAAYVHRLGEAPDRAESANQALNHLATARLAEQAFSNGVQRFVFVSSIKANGEVTSPGKPFTPASVPHPEDAYGRAKLDGERALQRIASDYKREFTVVRPPLVYGPGVRANFRALLTAIARGVPLPLGCATENRRSLIYVGNLADCLVHASVSAAAANRVLLPSDGVSVSTATLLRTLGKGLSKPARLWPVPLWMLNLAAKLSGRTALTRRLLGSLEVADSYLLDHVRWSPLYSFEQAVGDTARWYLEQRGRHAR